MKKTLIITGLVCVLCAGGLACSLAYSNINSNGTADTSINFSSAKDTAEVSNHDKDQSSVLDTRAEIVSSSSSSTDDKGVLNVSNSSIQKGELSSAVSHQSKNTSPFQGSKEGQRKSAVYEEAYMSNGQIAGTTTKIENKGASSNSTTTNFGTLGATTTSSTNGNTATASSTTASTANTSSRTTSSTANPPVVTTQSKIPAGSSSSSSQFALREITQTDIETAKQAILDYFKALEQSNTVVLDEYLGYTLLRYRSIGGCNVGGSNPAAGYIFIDAFKPKFIKFGDVDKNSSISLETVKRYKYSYGVDVYKTITIPVYFDFHGEEVWDFAMVKVTETSPWKIDLWISR